MKQLQLLACAFAFPISVFADDGSTAPPLQREGIEWCDIWIAHANEDKLPRVLLIGDSITRGYSDGVDKELTGKAYVARLANSQFLNDPMLLAQIAMVLDNVKFDVIHFNNGMHGWTYSEDDYRKYFPAYLDTIRKHAPNAKLIWATTTPLKESKPVPLGSHEASDERIAARNAIALEFIKPYNIPVDDLNALMAGHPEYHDAGNVHFNNQGKDLQAAHVAAEIVKVLTP